MVVGSSQLSLYRSQANQPVYTAVLTTAWPKAAPVPPPEQNRRPAEDLHSEPPRRMAPQRDLLASLSAVTLLDSTPLHERVNRSQILAAYAQQDLFSRGALALASRGDEAGRQSPRQSGDIPAPAPSWEIVMVPEGVGTMIDTYV